MNYDPQKYKAWTWKHPLVLHWIINPGLMVNELLLGQRVPKVMLIERDKSKTLAERSVIPCPHCGTLHSGMKWSVQNHTAFKNWFGLYCDHCGGIIPCQWNATSLVVLTLTFPIWYWFKDRLKARWLQEQREKFSRPLNLVPPKFVWWQQALGWAVMMFIAMEVLVPLVDGSGITLWRLLIGVPVWTISGLVFGLFVKALIGAVQPKQSKDPQAGRA